MAKDTDHSIRKGRAAAKAPPRPAAKAVAVRAKSPSDRKPAKKMVKANGAGHVSANVKLPHPAAEVHASAIMETALPSPPPRPEAPKARGAGDSPNISADMPLPDFDALAHNMARLVEQGGRVLAAYVKPRESGEIKPDMSDEVTNAVKTLGQIGEHWLSDPARALRAQSALSTGFMSLWGHTLKRMGGEASEPVSPPAPGDKRFADPQWRENPVFDFLAQAYTLTSKWADDLVTNADGVDAHIRDKAHFYVRQLAGALSPSNFVGTNPELLRETLKHNGDNLVRGLNLLAEDIAAGKGNLKIRQVDTSTFELGVNMATTPGKVVYRNDLMELIQYAPATQTVFKRPLLIVPPWINKFYILDLNPEKSFIKWAVAQGLTVFVVSWVNPDGRHADKSFEHYMR